jgi:hypothetical protein
MYGILTMKKLLFVLLLGSSPALADDMTLSIGSVSQTFTLSAADQTKFDEWVQDAYKCNTGPGCTPYTLDESKALWATATLQGTINNVDRFHKAKAAQDAAGNVPPIAPVVKNAPKNAPPNAPAPPAKKAAKPDMMKQQ